MGDGYLFEKNVKGLTDFWGPPLRVVLPITAIKGVDCSKLVM